MVVFDAYLRSILYKCTISIPDYMQVIHRGRGAYGNLDTEDEARRIQMHICTENRGLSPV